MKPTQQNLPLAITLGDMNGIGPEVALKAAYRARSRAARPMVLIGDAVLLQTLAPSLSSPCPERWQPGAPLPDRSGVYLWDPQEAPPLTWRPGRVTAAAARRAMHWVRLAVEGCLEGRFAGVVTAPVCKEGLMRAGLNLPGHTEYLAQCCGVHDFGMMLIGAALRVLLVTRHMPLREVPEALDRAVIVAAIRLTAQALPWILDRPGGRIAVCGLNPHAGDGGALGDEERRLIAPAIRLARRGGLDVTGPHAADAVFFQAAAGAFDAVVAMYHDQGLGPLKTLAFDRGINLTLGLPIVRTSPDHGTAFDKAGKNCADARSMAAAIRLAWDLAGRPNPWRAAPRGKGQ